MFDKFRNNDQRWMYVRATGSQAFRVKWSRNFRTMYNQQFCAKQLDFDLYFVVGNGKVAQMDSDTFSKYFRVEQVINATTSARLDVQNKALMGWR